MNSSRLGLLKMVVILLFCSHGYGVEKSLDDDLLELIKKNQLKALTAPVRSPREITKLGAMLFHETELSGPRNISCADCHHPRLGTSDALPFSIGQGGQGLGSRRTQNGAGVVRRNSPHLLNLGHPEMTHMFWDGRVFRDPLTGYLQTPEPGLNGEGPLYKDIAQTFSMSLSVQAIFPIVDALEMKGASGNEIAEAQNNFEAWRAVVKRLTTGSKAHRYLPRLQKAYPTAQQFHIGHVGEALGSFIKDSFVLLDTPYDRYLKGDSTAMTEEEKKGLKVFLEGGQCIRCHDGVHLSNFKFESVGTPQVTWEKIPVPYDEGRFEVTKKREDRFKFKTPTLRNLALTAPYMHSGVFQTLEEVVEHYDHPQRSLERYTLQAFNGAPYHDRFVLDTDEERNKLRIELISIDEVRRGTHLTAREKEGLVQFLKTGLLDYRMQRGRN